MGGNRFRREGVEAIRLPAADYQGIAGDIVNRLSGIGVSAMAIPHYREKPDFGDLDLVVTQEDMAESTTEGVAAAIGATHCDRAGVNDPTQSFIVMTPHGPFQVDLVLAPARLADFALRFMSWGDAGSLASLVGRQMGLKIGQNGMLLALGGETDRIEIEIGTDFTEALETVGLDAGRHRKGFDAPEDVYRWIADGSYFDPGIYALERLTSAARHRIRKRSFYLDFIDWLETERPQRRYDWGPVGHRREEWQRTLLSRHPETMDRYGAFVEERAKKTGMAAFFNSRDIMEATGVRDTERLQHLMNAIRKHFGLEGLQDLCDKGDKEQLVMAATRIANDGYMPKGRDDA